MAGVDGCRDGWLGARAAVDEGGAVREIETRVMGRWVEVVGWCRGAVRIGVDMPIGLAEVAEPGGRRCDRAARRLLGERGSSVFSAPARGVLGAGSYEEALSISRSSSEHGLGLSKQAWNLVGKVRELDEWMTPARQRRVREVHPEVGLAVLGGGAMRARKATAAGERERAAVLSAALGVERAAVVELVERGKAAAGAGCKRDDVVDALACLAVAAGMARGEPRWARARRVERDARGLAMEIVGVG